MELTQDQFDRQVADFKRYAGDENNSVSVSATDGIFTVLCSELAMYRIGQEYNFGISSPYISFGYSENLGKFYFRLTTDFTGDFTDG